MGKMALRWLCLVAVVSGCVDRTEVTLFDTGEGIPYPGGCTLTASPTTVAADGVAVATLTTTVRDINNNPVANTAVTLQSTGSNNVFGASQGSTDGNGIYISTLASTTAESKTITAYTGQASVSVTVVFADNIPSSLRSTLTVNPSSLTVGGSATVVATINDVQGNPVANQNVTLAASGLRTTLVPAYGTTDGAGTFTATVSSTTAQGQNVIATTTVTRNIAAVTFLAGSPNGTTSTFSTSARSAPADGTTAIGLMVSVRDMFGNPIANQAVSLQSTGSGYALNPHSGNTSASGAFHATMDSNTPGTFTLTANAGTSLTAVVDFTPLGCEYQNMPPAIALPGNLGSARAVVTDDINGDGKLDVVAVDATTDQVVIALNQRGGYFELPYTYTVGSTPQGLAVADLNNDGKADIITANLGDGSASVWFGNGDGTMGAGLTLNPNQQSPTAVVTADLNQDGAVDLAFVGTSAQGLTVMLNTGNSTFAAAVGYSVGPTPYGIAAGLLNNDAFPDVVVANRGNGSISVLLGGPGGVLQTAAPYNVGTSPQGVAIADMNGDSVMDVLAVNNGSSNVSVLLGTGGGILATATNYPADTAGNGFGVGDINGDGHPDVAVVGGSAMNVLFNAGSGGTLGAPVGYTGCASGATASVGDISGDNIPDVVMGCSSDGLITTFVNTGSGGTFARVPTYPVSTGHLQQVAVADFNQDGNMDAVVSNPGAAMLSAFLGVGAGILGSHIDTAVSVKSVGIAAGNLNNDTFPDVALTTAGIDYVMILWGAGDGTFVQNSNVTVGPSPSSVVVADLNGDGNNDLAVSAFGSSTVSVVLNNGNATFAAPANSNVPLGPQRVMVADLDGNGSLDLATTGENGGAVGVLLNQGGGVYPASATAYAVGSLPIGLAAADFNGDGREDLVVANNGSNTVSLLLGQAGGTFGSASALQACLEPFWIESGDLNNDGRADFAVSCQASGLFEAFYGRGDGTFDVYPFLITADAQGIALGDLDNNGVPDVLAVGGSATLAVMLGGHCVN